CRYQGYSSVSFWRWEYTSQALVQGDGRIFNIPNGCGGFTQMSANSLRVNTQTIPFSSINGTVPFAFYIGDVHAAACANNCKWDNALKRPPPERCLVYRFHETGHLNGIHLACDALYPGF